jgi:hypothetical protein
MKYLLSLCLCLLAIKAVSNDSILITQLLQKIEQLQVKSDGIFPKGSIPSYRKYAHNPDRYKADINPFYTGLTAFTLLNIRDRLTSNQKAIADTIIKRARHTYSKFENRKKNGLTYNFWPTDTPQIFPNSGWLNLFNKTRALPDDMDDTVIILMSLEAQDSKAKAVHQLMQNHSNKVTKTVNNTFEEYKNLPAYSTWFGKKMAIEFDICVLSNILFFVQKNQLEWTASDSACLALMVNAIKSNQIVNSAKYISPQYATTPIILYHLSRLMALKPISELEALKSNLINQALVALNNTSNFMEKVILSSSLIRWGETNPIIEVKKNDSLNDLIENESFVFFIANMGSIYPNYLKKFLTQSKLGTFYYYSPAYNYVLLLENLILQKNNSKS